MFSFIHIEGEVDCYQEVPRFALAANIATSASLLETTDRHVFFNGHALLKVELANGRWANPNL